MIEGPRARGLGLWLGLGGLGTEGFWLVLVPFFGTSTITKMAQKAPKGSHQSDVVIPCPTVPDFEPLRSF